MPKEEYSIFKTCIDGRVLVRRLSDGETLVGQPWDINSNSRTELSKLLAPGGPLAAAASLLNHPNLVNIHTELIQFPVVGVDTRPTTAKRYLLWDYCDAGTVASLLDDPPVKATATGFLPESLVWHVLLDMLRALQWLHEGVRDIYDVDYGSVKGRCSRIRGTLGPEREWMPVLHMAVRPENVFLMQPRGIETYGACKLGEFSWCEVSGHPDTGKGSRETPLVAWKEEDVEGGFMLRKVKRGWKVWDKVCWDQEEGGVREAQNRFPMNERPFTRGAEIFDLGTILYHMMTGKPIPGVAGKYNAKGQDCMLCGCNHVTWGDQDPKYVPCPHACYPDIDLNWMLGKDGPLTDYTPELRETVDEMLRGKWDEKKRASTILDVAWEKFQAFVATPEGEQYRDVFDDIWWRQRDQRREEMEVDEVEKELGGDISGF